MILGVTGGIATGKSSVTALFAEQGVPIVSADELAREVVSPGSAGLREIVARFGDDLTLDDGTLDRDRLAEIVFADAGAREELNRITHPAIARLAESRLAELAGKGAEIIVYEAPLLFEAGAEERVDKVLVVTAQADEQQRRLMERDGVSAAAAKLRIDAQLPISEKVRRADYVIDNSGTPDETARQVFKLFEKLLTADDG